VTTRQPLRFETKAAASAWLAETNNFGLIHDSAGRFIALQFADGAVWAFTAPDEMVLLPDW
jgi:hypothetical protein